MKKKLLYTLTAAILFLMPVVIFAQAPNLGTAANFVLFSTNGAVSNTGGLSHLTGNVGTNNGSSTAFGNVDGVMHDQDSSSAKCSADLLIAYNLLNSTTATFFPAPLLGNGDTLIAGVYSISGAATLNLDLTLNAKGNSSAVFIFKIQGSFSANASSKIKLINGAQACNVFWKVEGLVSMASGTSMKGTIIANNAAIKMNTGDTLEGRALSTAGAITVDGILAYTPIGCGSTHLTGPTPPALGSTECYAIFSASGSVTNTGVTNVTGDVGTNVGLTTGFDTLKVTGKVHPIPDVSTDACAADLLIVYDYLNTLTYDIELLYPAQFGHNLVLTPHTYLLDAATVFTDTLFLNAQGDTNAVFVFQINGAISTSTYSKVLLINGAQAKNVYWMVEGEVNINEYSIFRGTIVSNNGAISLKSGVTLDGRAFTTKGALSTLAITATMPPGCGNTSSPKITVQPGNKTVCAGSSVSFLVNATGTGLTYRWRKGNVNLTNGGNISGVTTAKLTINPANTSDAASNYNVVIAGTMSPSDTSVNVSLAINTAPSITMQPTDKTVNTGSSASFTVVATGTGLTYHWRKGVLNLTNAGSISGVTTATLTINPVTIADTASNYNVVIAGTCLPNSISKNASLSISNGTAPTVVSTEPGNNATGILLNKIVTVTFSVPMMSSTLISPATNFTLKQTITSTPVTGIVSYSGTTASFTPASNLLPGTQYTATITTGAKNLAGIPMANSYMWTFSTGSILAPMVISTDPGDMDSNVSLNQIVTATFSVPMDQVTLISPSTTFTIKQGVTPVSGLVTYSGTTASFTPNSDFLPGTQYTATITTGAKNVAGTPMVSDYVWTFTTGTTTSIAAYKAGNSIKAVSIYPNPFNTSIDIILNDALQINRFEIRIYNVRGEIVMLTAITKQVTTLATGNLPSGNYFYKIIGNNKIIQTGKLVSQQ